MGLKHFFISPKYLSSLGFTAIAVSPIIVSGRVVAIVIFLSKLSNLYIQYNITVIEHLFELPLNQKWQF